MEVISFVVTVFVGFFGTSVFGNLLNWPDAGAVFSIATVGAIILWTIRHHDSKDK